MRALKNSLAVFTLLFMLASCHPSTEEYVAANRMQNKIIGAKDNRTYVDNVTIVKLLKQYFVDSKYLANAKGTPVISWNRDHQQYELTEDHAGKY